MEKRAVSAPARGQGAARGLGEHGQGGGNQELGRGGATVYGDEIEGGERGTGAAHREEDDGELGRGRGCQGDADRR